jgi:hypothetical protein
MNKLDWYFIRRKLARPYWWFAYRFVPKHQYHIIRTELEPTYWDCDTRILHGAFAPFKEFMDNIYENKGHVIWDYSETEADENIPQEYIDERKQLWAAMECLYYWWTTREEREKELYKNFSLEREEEMWKEEEEMLCWLMSIRKNLWD